MKKHLFFTLLLSCGVLIGGGNVAYAASEPQANVAGQSLTTASGLVLDNNGEPVIGASVVEKGTTRGVATDIDGKFSFKVKPGSTLQISYVGCKPTTVKAGSDLKITLASDNQVLDDVVVVGYGTQKRVNLTGAVATVDVAKTMESRPQTNVAQALQGAVPGLSIVNTNGDINGQPSMTIRGTGTLSNGEVSKPLIVVDGVPMDDISFLNPSDIANISVLKDAASSSIYGTRAAFGVILVTTKTANTKEKVKVSYSNNFAWSGATVLPDYADVPQQIKTFIQANKRAGQDPELFGMYLDKMLPYAEAWQQQNGHKKSGYRQMRPFESWDNVGDYYIDPTGKSAPMYYADWDVKGIMFNDAAFSHQHNVTVQGSAGRTSYYLGFGYSGREDIMEFNPAKLKRYNVNANIQTNITDWMQAGVRFGYNNKVYDSPNTNRSTYTYMWRWGSFFGPYGWMPDADGNPVDCQNDIAMRKQAGTDHDVTSMTRMQAWAKADILDGLSINADFTLDLTNRNNDYNKLPVWCWNTWGGSIDKPHYQTRQNKTYAVSKNVRSELWTTNVFVSYEKEISNHYFKVMLGGMAERESYRDFWGQRNELLDNNLPEINLAAGDQYAGNYAWNRATAGFFGRINYNYKGIYLIELNGRYDGSSRFPANDQWAFFPSGSIGYRFSEEAYFENLKQYINNGKLRFSYGEIGNEAIGSNKFISTVGRKDINWIGPDGKKITAGTMPSLVSSTLSWERVRTMDVGLDLGFLNNTLTLGFDWYQRETLDMLAPSVTLPDIVGATAPYGNNGSLRTRGWELSLGWNQRFGEWDVYANFNIGDAKTVVTEWNNPSGLINQYFKGKVYGDIYGFETDRYFEESDFVKGADGNLTYAPGVASQTGLEQGSFVFGPGDIKFKDLDGNGKIDGGKGTKDDMGDLKVIGNSTPRYEYSFRLGAAWRGFDLDMYFQGVGKRDVWTVSSFVMPFMRGTDATYAHQESYNEILYNEAGQVKGYNINQNNKYPCMYGGGANYGTVPGIDKGRYNFYPQSKYLVDMSYLRFKNITFGYTIPKQITRKAYIDNLRVYFSAENPCMIYRGNSDYPLDPEMNKGSNQDWGRTTPMVHSYSFGLQVTF